MNATPERIGFPLEHALRFDVPGLAPGYGLCTNCLRTIDRDGWARADCPGIAPQPTD